MKHWIGSLILLIGLQAPAFAGDWYTHAGFPATGSAATSAGMRAELDAIQAGLSDKLPNLTGNGSKAVTVNSGGTGLTVTTGTLTLPGNFALSGASAVTLTSTGTTNVTLPTTGTLATLAGSETLTNKTLTSPLINTQITLNQTTANYTLAWNNPAAGRTLTIPDPLGNDTFVFLAATQTLTNKTLTAPAVNGIVTTTGLTMPAFTAGGTISGNTGITSVGTVTTGTWTAAAIGEIYGGTGQTTYATGDTLYASAANTLAKLSGNTTTTKKLLAQTGTGAASQAPVWSTLALTDLPASRFKNLGLQTRDMTAASGSVNYAHGVTGTPVAVHIFGSIDGYGSSSGFYDGSAASYLTTLASTGATTGGNGSILNFVQSAGNSQIATITVDATNVTLAWTKSGTPTGTANFVIIAEF